MKKANRTIRFSSCSTIIPSLIRMVAVCAALLSVALHGNTLSWSGGSSASGNWNDSANWGSAGTPANGDTVIFGAIATSRLSNTNNLSGLVLNQIRFNGSSGGFAIYGNAFTLTNSIIATNTAGANTIENNITLATSAVLMVVSNGVSLTLDGNLSGSVGVNKAGLGTLTYQGPGDNTYTGTTLVSGGTLQLNVGGYNAFEGPLVIGVGTGTGSPTVQDLIYDEISEAVPITINVNGTLNLNGNNETIGTNLTLFGGTIQTGSGTLTLSPNSTITLPGVCNSYVYGNLNIGTGTLTIQGNVSPSWLYLYAIVSGSADIVQNGLVSTYWSGTNTYTGNFSANFESLVVLANSLALGNTNNAMTINGTSLLALTANVNITNKSLTINSTNTYYPDYGLYVYGPSTNSWQANFTLGSACTMDVETNCALNLIGPIGGSGGVTKIGPGRLVYAGTNNNTYAGLTTVNAGELDLAKSGGVAVLAIPAYGPGLVIGDGVDAAVVRNYGSTQIWGFAPMNITNSGVWDLNNYYDSAVPLTLNGGQITTGSGFCAMINTVNVGGNSTVSGNVRLDSPTVVFSDNASLSMNASVSGYAANYGLAKAGSGYMYLSASNSYGGLTQVQGGWLYVENPLALGGTNSGTVVSSGASLVLDGNVCVTNEALTLNGLGAGSGWGALDVESGIHTWAGPVTNSANSTLDAWNSGSELHINGPISGGGGLELFGNSPGGGSHYFEGSAANTYAGTTTVDTGTTLLLGKSSGIKAVPGPLVMGNSTTVRLLNNFQIDSYTTPVTMSDSSLLDLAGFNEWIGPLSIQGAQITSGAGLLYLGGNIVVNSSTVAQSVISGRASIWNQTITITNSGYYYVPDLVISANVSSGGSGGQGLIKDGDGTVGLTGNNSFIGPVTINRGSLWAQTSAALGNTNTPATVNNGGNLFLDGGVLDFGLKPLVLNGSGNGFSFSALDCEGTCSWGGSITLNSDSTVCPAPGASLNLTGALSGPGGITEVPFDLYYGGTLIFAGSGANTYAGLTTVNGGTLLLNKTAGVNAVPGNLVVNGTVRLGASQQIADTADVMVNQGLFDLGAYDEYIDTLRGWGTVNFGSGGWIYLGVNNGSSEFDGSFTGIGYASGWTVGKTGSGTFTMTGTNTFSAGNTTIGAGKMVINGYQPQSPVIVYSGATLGGSGTVGTIAASGNISPGNSPGILTSSNLTFASSGQYTVDLNGPTPGVGYDQLNVRGTNTLANATLTVIPAFNTPVAIGQKFVIINNDLSDAITGTFSGLAEGATNTVGGYKFTISYAGGTGNDVVLTLTALPGAVAGSTVTSGDGNHGIDPNDCNNLSLVISNQAGTTMSGINATLSTTTEGVLITQPYATYPNIPASGSGANIAPFQISTLPAFVCGTPIYLQLIVNSSLGSFTINFVLQSGESSGAPNRYDNSVATSIPDVGSIDSTNTVSGFAGPVMKVAVSLYLTHTYDQDLTNISLIGPDGTTVMLSAANGGSGQNYGSGTSDASRTTFDDAAATSITSGTAPFVGTFRPQSPLSAFIGSASNGNWRLHIADGYGGSLGTLRAWSLFLYPVACGSGGGACDVCMPAITNAITLSDPVQNGRWIGNSVVASCGTPKTWPGTSAGSFHFDEYSFTNTSPADACVTVELQSPSNILATAYLNSFDPASITSNYLGDAGNSTHGGQTTFSGTVPAGATFLVVVTEVIANAGTQPYTLQLSGLPCPPPTLNIQPVATNQARLYWPTWAGGYLLESESNLISSAWATVTNEPIVGNHQYNVTNSSVSPINGFYRLYKP